MQCSCPQFLDTTAVYRPQMLALVPSNFQNCFPAWQRITTADFKPKFLRRYADLNAIMTDAVGSYVSDVKACDFPNEKEQY